MEVWKCLGETVVYFLSIFFNTILESESFGSLAKLFKNKRDVHSSGNYRGITLASHSMKLWERVLLAGLRGEVTFSEQRYGFMQRKSITDALFTLSMDGDI